MNNSAALTLRTISDKGHSPSPRQRILLRYWGVADHHVPTLPQRMSNLGGRLVWTDDGAAATPPDMVINLIEPSAVQSAPVAQPRHGGRDPAAAMRHAFRRGDKELALVLGSAHLLPQRRYGCWIASGRRNAVEALGIIACTLLRPGLDAKSCYRWNLHDLTEANVLCMLTTESASDMEALTRRVIAALGIVLGLSYTTPARIIVSAQETLIANLVSKYPVDRERVHLVANPDAENCFSAEIVVVYPWPVNLAK